MERSSSTFSADLHILCAKYQRFGSNVFTWDGNFFAAADAADAVEMNWKHKVTPDRGYLNTLRDQIQHTISTKGLLHTHGWSQGADTTKIREINHSKFKVIPSMGSPENALKTANLACLTKSQSYAKMKKINRPSQRHLKQNLIISEGGQDTSASQISGHSFQSFSRKCT